MSHCKKKNDFKVQLFDNSAQLSPEWDDLVPENHFLRQQNISLSEQYDFPDISFLYALVTRNGAPVAVSYFQILQLKEANLDTTRLNLLQKIAWQSFVKGLRPKLLIAGHLFRHDICSFYWDQQQSDFEAYQYYQACIKKALRRSHAIAALAKDIPEALSTYFQHYAPKYLLLRNDISMEMSLSETWVALQDYEKALRHKYAQRYRKVRSKWDTLEIKELDTREVQEQEGTIYQLYKQVSNRQQVRLGVLSRKYLPFLKKENPEALKIWMAYHEGKPVAFFSAWVHNGVFDMFYIGLDYSYNEELQLYFNILFFAVEQGINFRKGKVILGRTALEAKARLGCKPRYLSTFLYIRHSAVRNIIMQMQQNIHSQEGEWENRHPFK